MRTILNSSIFEMQSFNVEKLNFILAPNGGGKTILCETLKDAFEGKLKGGFVFNGEIVKKDDYFVFHVKDTDTLDIESSLSAKSELKNRISFTVDTVDEILLNEIESKLNELSHNINYLLSHVELIEGVELKFDVDFKEILVKNVSIIANNQFLKTTPFSVRRKFLIDLNIDKIRHLNQKCILIIDEYDLGLSEKERFKLLDKLNELALETDCIIFVSSSRKIDYDLNFMYTNNFQIENTLIDDAFLIEFIAEREGVSAEDVQSLCQEEYFNTVISENKLHDRTVDSFLGMNNEKSVERLLKSNFK